MKESVDIAYLNKVHCKLDFQLRELIDNQKYILKLEREFGELRETVREFFEYLDYTEESDSGKIFHPIHIGSVRVHLTQKVDDCLKRMKEMSK